MPQAPLFFCNTIQVVLSFPISFFKRVILSCCNMSFPHSFMASPTHTPITIKKPHNYYSQSCPLLGSVCEFNFFLSLYIWELHSLQHPASLYMFLSVFHSHSWNRRINLGSDVPLFSFKKNHTSTAENMNLKRKCRSHFLYFMYPWKREWKSVWSSSVYIFDLAYRIRYIWLPWQR